ncbi:UNVERIFIED_CONTAM: hypothetical protein FKN15_048339 [Acipenser sinensis]
MDQQPPNVQQGASSENLKDLEEAVTLTSASSSNSDLPSFAESEKVTIVRRHSTKTFTGIRFFGRRCSEEKVQIADGASSENLKDLEEAVTLTSASSSNSDLPSFAESEKVTIVRRHSTKTFTGIRFFGRRCSEEKVQIADVRKLSFENPLTMI